MQGFINFWLGIIDYTRMESRKDYWCGILINFAITLLLIILGLFIRVVMPYIAIAYAIISIAPTISMTVRRLHDVDESGFYLLFILIPIGGIIMVLLKTIKPTLYDPNQYEKIENTAEEPKTETDNEEVEL